MARVGDNYREQKIFERGKVRGRMEAMERCVKIIEEIMEEADLPLTGKALANAIRDDVAKNKLGTEVR